MDRPPSSLGFAVIGHQDSWHNITDFINCIRTADQEALPVEKIKDIFSFIPPRDLFKVKVRSATGQVVNGVYIETFIDPDKLTAEFTRTNISKVIKATSHAKKMGAKIITLGGFTSLMLEGNVDELSGTENKFTTGNSLTAAFIVKGIEKAAANQEINLKQAAVLIIGATGDIGIACINYFKHTIRKFLLCARNSSRLTKLSEELLKENIDVTFSICLQELVEAADIIICVASSRGIVLGNCKKGAIVCDAGYPKNLEKSIEDDREVHLFHGGMGQVTNGYNFIPDYSNDIYRYPAPYVIHGCILEAMVLALENKFETYSAGKGNITHHSINEIYNLSVKHGIHLAPFYNAKGLWHQTSLNKTVLK
jgi:fatty aldehyde-generating acyl-ACP reductase